MAEGNEGKMISETTRFELPKAEKSSARRMEYHTERIVTVKFHPSVVASIVLAGIFFVVSAYLSH